MLYHVPDEQGRIYLQGLYQAYQQMDGDSRVFLNRVLLLGEEEIEQQKPSLLQRLFPKEAKAPADEKWLENWSEQALREWLKDYLDWVLDKEPNAGAAELFPAAYDQALVALFGEKGRATFAAALAKMIQFPYSRDYYRRAVRSTDYRHHCEGIVDLFVEMMSLAAADIDLLELIKTGENPDGYYIYYSAYLYAQIDAGDEALIATIDGILSSGRSSAPITYALITSVIRSDNQALQDKLIQLLLAAKGQEGLRQAICENIDRGSVAVFGRFFHVIVAEDLLRFSSVKRALGTWIGLGEEYGDRLSKKEIALIDALLRGEITTDELLGREDNVALYIALWYLGSQDIELAMAACHRLLAGGVRHKVLLVSYYLHAIALPDLQGEIARKMLQTYPDDGEIWAAYYSHLFTWAVLRSYEEVSAGDDDAVMKKAFTSQDEALAIFGLAEALWQSMKKKELVFDPAIFPWYAISLSKDELAQGMICIAAWCKGGLIDQIGPVISSISTYRRGEVITTLLKKPANQVQRDALIAALMDKSEQAQDAAYEIIRTESFAADYQEVLLDALRLKSGNLRKRVLALLFTLSDEALIKGITYLLGDKLEQRRLGGLDLVLQAKETRPAVYEVASPIALALATPSSAEAVLIGRLGGNGPASAVDDLYDATYQVPLAYPHPIGDPTSAQGRQAAFDALYKMDAETYMTILTKLDRLYTQHENHSYVPRHQREEVLLADGLWPCKDTDVDADGPVLTDYPLPEVWQAFYKEEIGSLERLVGFYLASVLLGYYNYYRLSQRSHDPFDPFWEKVLHLDKGRLTTHIQKSKYGASGGLHRIIMALYRSEVGTEPYRYQLYMALLDMILANLDQRTMTYMERTWRDEEVRNTILHDSPLRMIWLELAEMELDDEAFCRYFMATYELYRQFVLASLAPGERRHGVPFSLAGLARAQRLGLIGLDGLYQEVLEGEGANQNIAFLSRFVVMANEAKGDFVQAIAGGGRSWWFRNALGRLAKKPVLDDGEQADLGQLAEIGQQITSRIIAQELVRGDTPAPYSRLVVNIYRIYGQAYLIQILQALGKEKLSRGMSWGGEETKRITLSHLLRVSYPLPEDTAEALQVAVEAAGITADRLCEVAMYAPGWVDLIGACLGWPEFAAGCYYFQAHISDVEKDKAALFAQYTPIDIEDLALGAFDINWFQSSYAALGEERFEKLYQAAKYISDGGKHARARMFADAVLGKYTLAETEARISEKRNKDLVASYGLIPLGKNQEKDLLRRYQFLQKFRKESKQFGAQRQASEAQAVDIALDNLARTAGYSDKTRLMWRMETSLVQGLAAYFSPQHIGDVAAYLQVDAQGQTKVVYEKDGKALKSMPSKLKKDPTIIALKDTAKTLQDQYRRGKQLLEQSMEDETVFQAEELALLLTNPVLAPMVQGLVYRWGDHLGYYRDGHLVAATGEKHALAETDDVTIAHPYHLYKSGHWPIYQKQLFDELRQQPFKQVFRELYLLTEDEAGATESRRYAGHQIDPKRTVALLKTRRWVVEPEEGLQKVYYKQNIIVKLYALADWFSPADIEAPTLEWVAFFDRKTHEPLPMDQIAPVLFSEIMRDVDLVVSVAHIGEVDPEASHSTVELRRAIMAFNVELFALDNVTFSARHAIINSPYGEFTLHLGSGVMHQKAGSQINILPVHSQHHGRIFLPFVDDDPKTAEIMSKLLLFAEDEGIKDPFILRQIKRPSDS